MKIFHILKNFLWILYINIQNQSNSNEISYKSVTNFQKILKLAQELLHYLQFSLSWDRATNGNPTCIKEKSCVFPKESTWHRSKLAQVGANWSKLDFRAFCIDNWTKNIMQDKFSSFLVPGLSGVVVSTLSFHLANRGSIPLHSNLFYVFFSWFCLSPERFYVQK